MEEDLDTWILQRQRLLSLMLVLVLGDDHKGSACKYFHVDLDSIDSYFSVLYKTLLIACESNEGHLEFL